MEAPMDTNVIEIVALRENLLKAIEAKARLERTIVDALAGAGIVIGKAEPSAVVEAIALLAAAR